MKLNRMQSWRWLEEEEPEIAEEIITAAERRQEFADLGGCPHCGKPLD